MPGNAQREANVSIGSACRCVICIGTIYRLSLKVIRRRLSIVFFFTIQQLVTIAAMTMRSN